MRDDRQAVETMQCNCENMFSVLVLVYVMHNAYIIPSSIEMVLMVTLFLKHNNVNIICMCRVSWCGSNVCVVVYSNVDINNYS